MSADRPREPLSSWHRLHPRMLLVHPLHELLRALPLLVATLVIGATTGSGQKWSLLATAGAVLLGPARWYTTEFRIADGQVQLRRGLLQRRLTRVPLDRIRTVDVTAHPLHRLLGLARVEIGTGSREPKREDRLELDALSTAQAARLRAQLFPVAARPTDHAELVRAHTEWMRYAPLNVGGPVLLGLCAAILHEARLDRWLTGPAHALAHRLSGPHPWTGLLEATAAALLATTAASTAFYVVMFGDFRLLRLPDATLQTTHGLLTARTVTLKERQIRGVEIAQTLPVRAVGGARCLALTSGLRGRRSGALLVPSAPAAVVRRVAADVLRTPAPVDCPLTPHPRRARRRRTVRAAAASTAAAALFTAAAATHLAPTWPWPLVLALFPLAALTAADGYRGLGHAVSGRYLVGRSGVLVRRRWALSREGIVGVRLRSSPFQRRARLVTLTATTAAGRGRCRLYDLGAQDAVALVREVLPGLLEPFLEPPATPSSTDTSSAGAG